MSPFWLIVARSWTPSEKAALTLYMLSCEALQTERLAAGWRLLRI